MSKGVKEKATKTPLFLTMGKFIQVYFVHWQNKLIPLCSVIVVLTLACFMI